MSDQEKKELTQEELEAIQDFEAIKAKRKAKKANRGGAAEGNLSIDSLLDILTILLVFLLMNYSTDVTNVTPTDDLQLVKSIEIEKTHKQMVPIGITRDFILVDNKPIVQVKDGRVSASAKREGADGFFITPLFDSLEEEAKKQRKIAQYNSSIKFEGQMMVIVDENVPYRLLSEVLYTAGQAEFAQYEFVVLRNE